MSQATANVVAITTALIFALVLGVPMYHEIQPLWTRILVETVAWDSVATLDFSRVGPLSGLCLFGLAAPLVIAAAPTLLTKLAGVLTGFVASGGVVLVVSLAESGHSVGAGFLGGLSLLVLALLFSQQGRMQRAKAHATHRLHTDIERIITQEIRRLRLDEAPTDPHAPTRAFLGLAERMALGVAWQAARSGDPCQFARQIRHGLKDLAARFDLNRRADPLGIASRATQCCLRRIEAHLLTTSVTPTWGEFTS